MNHITVQTHDPLIKAGGPILLVGGGDIRRDTLLSLAAQTSALVAADGGALALLDCGLTPDAVIGDLDSLPRRAQESIGQDRIHHISEQDSTDFEKCLHNIKAPLIWAAGFLGARVDHELAAMTVLARCPGQRCILVGDHDVIALLPPRLTLNLPAGTRVSLFPLGPVRGEENGLRWPLAGVDFAPQDRIGTSNEASGGQISLRMDAPHMLIILPALARGALQEALLSATEAWPARA